MTTCRPATKEDLPAIVAIYNEAIEDAATADTEPVNAPQRVAWLADHPPDRYPVIVAERDERIVGWASLSPYRPGRGALRYTAEISYFVRRDDRRSGVGGAMVSDMLQRAAELDLRTLFAILLEDNEASIGLLERFGFERWGHLPDIADFDGREVGHVYYGLRIA